jgi:predicted CXXCH cytochrome family protein
MSARLARIVGGIGLVAAVIGTGWWLVRDPGVAEPPHIDDSLAVRPLSASPYHNTRPDAQYIGSAACIRCHTAEHQAYLRTGMSRSTAEVKPELEPPDAVVTHPVSHRRFEIHRHNGQVRHREVLTVAGRSDVVLSDWPVKYAIGSGRYGRTYAVEADGFLVESPISWYATKQQWGMSPGYDHAAHKGFERPIGTQCVYCHLGQTEVVENSEHKYRILEPAIGCERCHGPGSLHVARWDQPGGAAARPAEIDYTIVNPSRLSRELSEAVCQQCHLSGDALVLARGRKLTDFRPGLPLTDVQLVFRFTGEEAAMSVTGHVEQLHASKCYQKSDTLTCLTCHDPHGFPEPAERVEYYRATCLSCHAESACKVDPAQRAKESPQNSCVQCHMPTAATDIPHVAFSHHRIGIHPKYRPFQKSIPAWDPASGRDVLEPFHDLSGYSELDRKRALGLAYRKAGSHAEIGPVAELFNRRAYQLLSEVWDQGLRDGAIAAALATGNYRFNLGDVQSFAEAALADPHLDGSDLCAMLFLLADAEFKRGNSVAASERLRRLTTLRRNAVDWSYLSRCERAQGRLPEGLQALETAARIGTTAPRFHRELADLYQKLGDWDRAAWHRLRVPEK